MGLYYSTPTSEVTVELTDNVLSVSDKPPCNEGIEVEDSTVKSEDSTVAPEDSTVKSEEKSPKCDRHLDLMTQSVVNLDTNVSTDFKSELPKYRFWGMFIDNTNESILIDRDQALVELDPTNCTANEIADTVNAIKKMSTEEFFYLINHTDKGESHRIKGDICMVVPNTLQIVDTALDITIPHHRIFKLVLKRVIHHIKEKLEKKREWKTQKSDYAIVTD